MSGEASSIASDVVAELELRVRLKVRETSKNRGPEIDGYHRRLAIDPARRLPWCTSGIYDVVAVVCERRKLPNPLPRTAKAVRVWDRLYRVAGESNPAPGRLYILDHGPPESVLTSWRSDSYTDDGHIGACVELDELDDPFEISGNTFEVGGSREGNCWARHHGTPEITHGGMLLGWIDLDRALAAAMAGVVV